MIILDTNLVSYAMAREPVTSAWLSGLPRDEFYTTSITRAEVRFGLARLPSGHRKVALIAAAGLIFREFDNKTLPFNSEAADRYGDMMAQRRRAGRPMRHEDGQIAAIALARGATLATRNTRDFEGCDVTLINPFDG